MSLRKTDSIDSEQNNTTVWSFPRRGGWATHSPDYRGNFAPQIARNIILKYSNEGDKVLDPMVGGGTTLIECKLLNRRGIGLDINPKAIERVKEKLKFECDYKYEQELIVGVRDIRDLSSIKNDDVDLILTHPPYLNIINYSNSTIKEDLSNIPDVRKFCDQLEIGVRELFRVLKEDKYCAVLIGGLRKGRHYVPLAYYVMERFLRNGFVLKEEIIKIQHNCGTTSYWKKKVAELDFYLIMHEHLFVFRKPKHNENLNKIQYSLTFPEI